MKISTHADFDATPEEVFAVISDPEFVAAKAEQMAVGAHEGTVTTRGSDTVLRTTRSLPSDELPDVARKFVGPVLTIVEEQAWGPARAGGERDAVLRLHVQGVPVSLEGRISLRAKGSGATQDLTGDLSAKIPFMGSTIEKAAAPAIEAGIGVEVDLIKKWLAKR